MRVNGKVSSLQAQGKRSAGDGDENRRFLADLRSLRDAAALDFDELAARAHYPTDVLKEAESGPVLPTLPILAAYVRACDGDVPEWEERWRRLGFEASADPGLPVRPAGASAAAVAGAKAGVSVGPPEAYDADRIRAVLRGATSGQERSSRGSAAARPDRDGQGTATAEPRVPEGPASWNGTTSWGETARWDVNQGGQTAAGWGTDASADADAGWGADTRTSWDGFAPQPKPRWDGAAQAVPEGGPRWDGAADSADLDGVAANGNYYVSESVDAFADTAVFDAPDVAQAEAMRRDPFSADWLHDGELTSPPEPARQDRAEASPAAEENWFTPRETTDREPAWSSADTQSSAVVEDTWFTPRERTDDRQVPPERPTPVPGSTAPVMGFWTPSAAAQASTPTEVRRPDPPRAETTAIVRAGWPATAETPSDVLAAADRTDSALAQGPAATSAQAIAGAAVPPAVPPGPVVPPSKPRSDRLYPVRLLVVIVVAALIGSILVLLLR